MTYTIATSALCRPGSAGIRSLQPGWIAVEGEMIIDVGSGRAPADAVDVGDSVLAPGFVDLQCNGIGDDDFADANVAGWRRIASVLARHGVTAHCPTLVSAPLDSYDAACTTATTIGHEPMPGGSRSLGLHLEGPFLGGAPGAHDPGALQPTDVGWLDALLVAHPGRLRIVTLAPEADPGALAIRRLVGHDVVVALGHSTATYDEARAAADAGATVVTHLFNGMGPLHQRAPGLAGAALDDERLTPTLIADMVHVHPALVRLAFARRADLALVSDSVAMREPVVSRDGAASLPDGTLAGATLLLDGAVVAAVRAGIEPLRAIEAASLAPANIVGATDRGRVAVGARADLVALDPATFAVRRVWLGGDEVVAR